MRPPGLSGVSGGLRRFDWDHFPSFFPLQSKWISCRPSPQKIAEDGKVIAPPYSSLTEEYMDNFGFACQASKNLNKSLNTGWVFLAKKLNFSHPTLIGPEQILNNV